MAKLSRTGLAAESGAFLSRNSNPNPKPAGRSPRSSEAGVHCTCFENPVM